MRGGRILEVSARCCGGFLGGEDINNALKFAELVPVIYTASVGTV